MLNVNSPPPLTTSARKQQIRRLADASAPQRRDWLARASFFHAEDLLYLKFSIGKELACWSLDVAPEIFSPP